MLSGGYLSLSVLFLSALLANGFDFRKPHEACRSCPSEGIATPACSAPAVVKVVERSCTDCGAAFCVEPSQASVDCVSCVTAGTPQCHGCADDDECVVSERTCDKCPVGTCSPRVTDPGSSSGGDEGEGDDNDGDAEDVD